MAYGPKLTLIQNRLPCQKYHIYDEEIYMVVNFNFEFFDPSASTVFRKIR